jgi:hypothetical protein
MSEKHDLTHWKCNICGADNAAWNSPCVICGRGWGNFDAKKFVTDFWETAPDYTGDEQLAEAAYKSGLAAAPLPAEKLRALAERWRDNVPPECTCPPTNETMDSHFHKGDCPRYVWNRKNFNADTATQRKCANELDEVLREALAALIGTR